MYTVTHIDKSTKKIKGSREPMFYVSTDMKYSIYKQDKQLQDLVNAIWTNDLEQSFDEEWEYWLEDWIEFMFNLWSINIDRNKVYTRLSQWSYSFTLQIKSNKLFKYATQGVPSIEALLQTCHNYAITSKEQVYELKRSIADILNEELWDYITVISPKTVDYSEHTNKDCYISYLQFLMLLNPDRLYCIYDERNDDLIITDSNNFCYWYDQMESGNVERIDTGIYAWSSDRLNYLRSKYWISIRDKIAQQVVWLYDDESISRFEIQKKSSFIQLKITRTGKQAEDINKQLIQYGSRTLKKHGSSKLYEISTLERIDKLDLYNDLNGNLI